MSLPLLPAEQILAAYTLLENMHIEKSLLLVDRDKIATFQRYMKRQWFKVVGVNEFSVHNTDLTTNNPAESFNKKLKDRIKSSRRPGAVSGNSYTF
jgi:hypothetical protein